MPKFIFSIFSLLLPLLSFSQESKLYGNWILVRTVYDNFKFLEINHPDYSQSLIYEIQKDYFKVNGVKNVYAKFKDGQINYPLETINYSFKDDYLITQKEGSNLKNFFLKREDLLQKHPELTPQPSDNNYYIIDNGIVNYTFNQNVTLETFLIRELNEVAKNSKNKQFEIDFVLTSSNTIEHINIKPTTNFDHQIIKLLLQSQDYFKNNTGQNLLIKTNIQLNLFEPFHLNSSLRKYKDEIEEHYSKNNFNKVIALAPHFEKSIIKENQKELIIKSTQKYIAISHLAVGNTNEACEKFNQIGDLTNFNVRNYLIDFCKK